MKLLLTIVAGLILATAMLPLASANDATDRVIPLVVDTASDVFEPVAWACVRMPDPSDPMHLFPTTGPCDRLVQL